MAEFSVRLQISVCGHLGENGNSSQWIPSQSDGYILRHHLNTDVISQILDRLIYKDGNGPLIIPMSKYTEPKLCNKAYTVLHHFP